MNTISLFKNKYPNKTAIIVGTGPSADSLAKFLEQNNRNNLVLIGINRAICLRNDFDFIFIDNPKTFNIIKPLKDNTKHFCAPLFSVGKCLQNENIETPLVYFIWAYQLEQVLTPVDHVLNENLLYIEWGNTQSALHFSKKIGCNKVLFFGVEGKAINNIYHSKKIIETFGTTRQPLKKLDKDYAKSREKLSFIANKINIEIEYYQ